MRSRPHSRPTPTLPESAKTRGTSNVTYMTGAALRASLVQTMQQGGGLVRQRVSPAGAYGHHPRRLPERIIAGATSALPRSFTVENVVDPLIERRRSGVSQHCFITVGWFKVIKDVGEILVPHITPLVGLSVSRPAATGLRRRNIKIEDRGERPMPQGNAA